MIGWFVKDKDNLFNHNLWSGTDLNKSLIYNTEYITGHAAVSVLPNNNFSTNGNYSIELNPSGVAWVRFPILCASGDLSKIVTASVDIYSPNANCIVYLLFMDDNNIAIKTVSTTAYQNDSFTSTTLSNEIVDNTSKIWFNFALNSSNTVVYLDNFTANIQ